MRTINRALALIMLMGLCFCCKAGIPTGIPVAAPMNTELAGTTADLAIPSVFRVINRKIGSSGTGFLHKSGVILTAEHVIKDGTTNDVIVVTAAGEVVRITNIVQDASLDLAALMPSHKMSGPVLEIATNAPLKVGMQVSTWGFPEGYKGLRPLLTCGYISGVDIPGKTVQRIVVNAAFNRGNSGGPLVEVVNGTVIGVVCSKLAPLPPHVEHFLSVLKTNDSGVVFGTRDADGTTGHITEGQIIEDVLQYLRSQTQLVIGYACFGDHLVQFLRANKIEP